MPDLMQLPDTSSRPPVSFPWFPTLWQTVLFRNWGKIPPERIAKVLKTDLSTLQKEAEALGLSPDGNAPAVWLERGYLTVIRENWHLLPFEDICTLTGFTPDKLAFLLKEDDFLWHKMGEIKPFCPSPVYSPLTEEQTERTKAFREKVLSAAPEGDNSFDFLKTYTGTSSGKSYPVFDPEEPFRSVYSYFALYGDPLDPATPDPFPDALLESYAESGVNGIWLQGILYQLVPFCFDEARSVGWEKRLERLNDLIRRAASYGIGVYLYLNEPRSMDAAFFEKYPHLRGKREGDFYALCTSCPEVKEYLENASYELFRRAPGLAGFFTITMSENLTNCISRHGDGIPCPRCAERRPEEIIAEVSNLLSRGAKRANPRAKAITWSWAWDPKWANLVPSLLTEGQIVQSNSEAGIPIHIGGVDAAVADYSMSIPGPGETARSLWSAARENHLEAAAKVQFNCTWEDSALPFIPVLSLVKEHVDSLKACGVRNYQMSWTLGGAPSPNLLLVKRLMEEEVSVSDFLKERFGEELGAEADRGQQLLSAAFREFPFHIATLYYAPQNYGPTAPLFDTPTGWKATMIGFPYDDLDGWRSVYPREVFHSQLKKLVSGWRKGTELLLQCKGKNPGYDEFCRMAEACLCHFESTLNLTEYVMARDAGNRTRLREIICAERENVLKMLALRREDSRLGYEASNHYYYTAYDLAEKLVNLDWVEGRL